MSVSARQLAQTLITLAEEKPDQIDGVVANFVELLEEYNLTGKSDVILRHLLENGDNPFNREPLTKKELEEFNEREEILAKINDFNERKAKYSDS